MTLGEKIKLHRQRLGLSQEALAQELNVSRQAVTKWESNNGVPDIDNLIALSRVMEISLDELVLGDEARDVQDVKESFVTQRKKEYNQALLCIVLYIIAQVAWIIAVFLSTKNGNTVMAVVGAVNVMLIAYPLDQNIGKYRQLKKQKRYWK